WAFDNGRHQGDGNGFKLGRSRGGDNHIVDHNLSFRNRASGFDDNVNSTSITLTKNTAYANGGVDFRFNYGSHVLVDNIAYGGRGLSINGQSDSSNTWNLNVTVSDSDFVSTDSSLALRARKANGDLPDI